MFPGSGNGNPLQYSCLENHMDRGAWRVTVHGVTESDTTKHEQALIQFMRAKPSLHALVTSLKPPLLNGNGSFITLSVEIKLTTFTESWRKQRCSKKHLLLDCTPTIPKNLEQTTSLKMYKSEHLAKENIKIVNQHIKNTQNHIS